MADDDHGRPTIAPLPPGGGDESDLDASRLLPGVATTATAAASSSPGIPVLDPDRLRRSPACVIVVGMAGSGKTTLVAQLQRSLDPPAPVSGEGEEAEGEGDEGSGGEEARGGGAEEEAGDGATPDGGGGGETDTDGSGDSGRSRKRGYCLNLDPATKLVPYGASIDIRDTVDYKEVMHQHNLGPNGAIMTSLNLFVTKFDQVMGILERRAFGDGAGGSGSGDGVHGRGEEGQPSRSAPAEESSSAPPSPPEKALDYIIVDTPGQIEAFSWSASGAIITESLASAFPTVLAFVVDTPRCAASPHTFMSNMLYACSMSYRSRLPLVVVFNKTDVVPSSFAEEWMSDYDAFQEALDEVGSASYASGDEGSGYFASLTRSLGLVLDEFYATLRRVGVSAATGDGVEAFWEAVDRAAGDFEEEYVEDLRDRLAEREARERAKARAGARRFARDAGEEGAEEGSVNR